MVPFRRLLLAFAGVFALALLGVAAHPRALAAQAHCVSCPGDVMGPEVTITPGAATYSGTASTYSLAVTIEWCDENNLNATSRAITLNGVSVAGSFAYATSTHAGCGAYARSTGTISLPAGTSTLNAQMRDMTGNTGAGSATWSYSVQVPSTYTVSVTPDSGLTSPVAGGPAPVTFYVDNTGNSTATYSFTVTCDTPLTSCPANPPAATIAPNDPLKPISLTVTAGPAGSTPRIHLKAAYQNNGAIQDDGAITIQALGPLSPIVAAVAVNRGTTFDRSLCLTIAAGTGGATECGDLRLAHPLGTIRTVNRARTPTLIYNSATVDTLVNLAAVVGRAPGGATPASMTATVTVAGGTLGNVTWPAGVLPSSANARIVVPARTATLGTSGSATGLYGYTLQVTNNYTSGSLSSSVTGEMAVVDRRQSPFGAGWWLAGLERIRPQGNGILMWIGGDASVHRYTRSLQDTVYYFAPNLSRADTIKYDITSHTWTRFAGNGVRIHFDALGRHDSTTNRLGQVTAFSYLGTSDTLSGITVPRSPTAPTYQFRYSATTRRLASVVLLPATADSQVVTIVTAGDNRITNVIDPDGTSVGFGYSNASPLVTRRTDQRGHETWYAYDSANLLQTTTIDMGAAGPDTADIVTRYRPLQSTGYAAPVDTAQGYSLLDGPLSTPDSTQFWLDRFGAPARIRNALGGVTTITRADVNWPVRATMTRDPMGRVNVAEYDPVRGVLRTATDSGTRSSTGAVAVTRYEWDPKWDMVTKVTNPAGDSVRMGYDAATGSRLWQEDGRGAMSRVAFTYDSAGLLKTIHVPGTTGDQVFVYDGQRLNLRHARTALGYWSSSFADVLGRDTLSVTPIDAADKDTVVSSAYPRATVRTAYDAAGQDTLVVSSGPAMSDTVMIGGLPVRFDAPAEQLLVRNVYDANGNLLSVTRSTDPMAAVAEITTSWGYDNANRKLRETASDGMVTSFIHDHAGNVDTTWTRRGNPIAMEYDLLGRLTRRITPSTQYSEEGSFFGVSYPLYTDGLTIAADTARFTYDAAGRMLTADNGDARIKRSYYANGLLETDSLRIRTYATIDSGGDFATHVYGLLYSYDLDGRRATLQHPMQLKPREENGYVYKDVRYFYDAGGRLLSVIDGFDNVFGFFYSAAGQLDSLAAPGGIYETRGYDSDGRLTRRFGNVPGATLGNDDNYTYDARGKQLTASTRVEDIANGYSGLGALIGVTRRTKPIGAERIDERFTVDALGNQLTHSTHGAIGLNPVNDSLVYMYEAHTGRLAVDSSVLGNGSANSKSGTDRFFDASGNQRAFMTVGPVADIDYSYYGADEKLRVLDHRDCAGEPTIFGYTCDPESSATRHGAFEEYRYDALGRRVLVQSRRDQVCQRGDCLSAIERTVWDGDQVLYEIRYPAGVLGSRQDTVTKTYSSLLEADTLSLWTWYKTNCLKPSIDENGNSMCGVDTIPSRSQHYGRAMYLHGLGIDAPLAVTRMGYYERTQEPLTVMPHANWRELYFGLSTISHNTLTSSGARPDWPGDRVESFHLDRKKDEAPLDWFGNLVKEKRDGSGQLYMRNRYYDPATGRFTQEDPIGLAGGLNAYGFANGDPVTYSDPFGLCPDRTPCPTIELFQGMWNRGVERISAGADAVNSAVGMIDLGVSATAGHYTLSGEASTQDGFSAGHSLEIAGPSLGASIDVGVKDTPPASATTGSINMHPPVIGKHLGVSFNMYRAPGDRYPQPYGVTVHFGGGIGIETLFSATVDLRNRKNEHGTGRQF